ncbi:MAG: hypothetical protein ACOYKA_02415 [Legionellaceae bacterium]
MLSREKLSPVDPRTTPAVDPAAQAKAEKRAERLAGLERTRLNQEAAAAHQRELALRVAHLTADAGSEEERLAARREEMTIPDVSPEHQRLLARQKESMLREMQSRQEQPALGLHPLPVIDRSLTATPPESSPAMTRESVLAQALEQYFALHPESQGPRDGVRAPDPVRSERLMGNSLGQGLSLQGERERREAEEAIDLAIALELSEEDFQQLPPVRSVVPDAALPPAVARPRENDPTVLPKKNYSFIMSMMAQSYVKKASMILCVASLLCLGMAIAGILPLAVGVVLLGLTLLSSSIGFFAGKGAGPQSFLKENAQPTLRSAV